MKFRYQCHVHGVVAIGDTTDTERPETCPVEGQDGKVCGKPLFVSVAEST